jgi:hypothetical protein
MTRKQQQVQKLNPAQMAAVEAKKIPGRQLRAQAKNLVERNGLPPRRDTVETVEGFYLPPFYTKEAQQIDKAHNNSKMAIPISGVTTGVGGFLIAMLGWGSVGASASDVLVAWLVVGPMSAAMLAFPIPVFVAKSKHYKTVIDGMKSSVINDVADWAKKAYGVTMDRSNTKEISSCFTTGMEPNDTNYIVDQATGDKYYARRDPNGQIRLILSYRHPREPQLAAVSSAQVAKPKELAQQAALVLPNDAARLLKKLETTIAVLKQHELSVETAHAVERTESTVKTLVRQYHQTMSLSPSKSVHRNLVKFLQGQVVFVDNLVEEQAREIARQMDISMAAVTEATSVNHARLALPAVQRTTVKR